MSFSSCSDCTGDVYIIKGCVFCAFFKAVNTLYWYNANDSYRNTNTVDQLSMKERALLGVLLWKGGGNKTAVTASMLQTPTSEVFKTHSKR